MVKKYVTTDDADLHRCSVAVIDESFEWLPQCRNNAPPRLGIEPPIPPRA